MRGRPRPRTCPRTGSCTAPDRASRFREQRVGRLPSAAGSARPRSCAVSRCRAHLVQGCVCGAGKLQDTGSDHREMEHCMVFPPSLRQNAGRRRRPARRGQGVIHGGDTTVWFGANEETSAVSVANVGVNLSGTSRPATERVPRAAPVVEAHRTKPRAARSLDLERQPSRLPGDRERHATGILTVRAGAATRADATDQAGPFRQQPVALVLDERSGTADAPASGGTVSAPARGRSRSSASTDAGSTTPAAK